MKIFQEELSQACFVGSLGRGEAISTDNGRSVAFVAERKPVRQFLDARSGDIDSERGDKGGLTRAKGGEGSWERLTRS